MGQKLEVVRERLDVVDETVLLALREGSQSLNSLHVLAKLKLPLAHRTHQNIHQLPFHSSTIISRLSLSQVVIIDAYMHIALQNCFNGLFLVYY